MTQRYRFALAAWVSWLFLAPPHGSIAANEGAPEAVVRRATDDLNHGRAEEFANAMHPEALRQFRAALSPVIEGAVKDGKSDQILKLFPGVRDVSQLRQFDDVRFFTDYLRGMTGQSPETKKLLESAKIAVLGHVDEGKDTVHVVYRITIEDAAPRMLVASLRKDGARWAMLLSGDIEAMAVMMKQRAVGIPDLPDYKAMKVQPIGQLLEGTDRIHLIYRTTTPLGALTLKKVNVLTVDKNDPTWQILRSGNAEAIATVVKRKFGL